MHPEVHQDHPGSCPKCGMHLVPVQGGEGAATTPSIAIIKATGTCTNMAGRSAASAHAHSIHRVRPPPCDPAGRAAAAGSFGAPPKRTAGTIYTCPMHPEIRQDHPGSCPKCGMTWSR
jgi:Cu+-exporting ATPase